MAQRQTILYLQILDFKQLISDNRDLQSFHESLITTLSEKYHGEILLSIEGNSKICFDRPENAIHFALNIANRFHQVPEILFKMGIDYSEQVASKLSDSCRNGSILVSKKFYTSLDYKSEFNFILVGCSLFKDLDKPTEIYALAGSGLYIPTQNELTPGEKNKNSIAILPFHNTSSEKELDYICDGIAEEIIDSLSKFKDLFITARSSSFIFKNKEISIQDISRKLNVNYIVDGSIRKRNEEYRISYQLVDCSDGYNIISDTISSNFEALYDSEKKISKSIINFFTKNESVEVKEENNDYSIDPQAYSYYLKGKYLINKWNKEDAYRAIDFFSKALNIIPNYALAYAGLSSAYVHIAINGFADFKTQTELAVRYADLSIEADSSIHDGYVAKAVASFLQGNLYLPDLEKNITKALLISPCNAEIRMFNGMVFLFKENLERALSELKLAKQLDPFSNPINLRLGVVQYVNKDYQGAHNTFLSQLKEDAYKTNYLLRLTKCCIALKYYDKALEYLSKASKNDAYYGIAYACYLIIYKELKNEDKYCEYKSIIENQVKTDPSYAYNHAVLNYLKGNKELAIKYLEITFQDPMTLLLFVQYDTFWKDLHEHPLFIKQIVSKYKGKGNQIIKIESDTKEFIELNISDFLYAEAQDNYTLIAYKKEKRKIDKILRVTLANVSKQLCFKEINRCHRSYLINLEAGYIVQKSDNKTILKQTEFDISIPISRSKVKEIKELIKNR